MKPMKKAFRILLSIALLPIIITLVLVNKPYLLELLAAIDEPQWFEQDY